MKNKSILFKGDLLIQSNIAWPGKCVVCGRPCDEYLSVSAISANPMAFSEFAPTRNFPVRVHNKTYACGSHFLIQWRIAKFSGLVLEFLAIVIALVVVYFSHVHAPILLMLILSAVLFAFAIGGGMVIERKMRPAVWIKEIAPNRLMGTVNYTFIFRLFRKICG